MRRSQRKQIQRPSRVRRCPKMSPEDGRLSAEAPSGIARGTNGRRRQLAGSHYPLRCGLRNDPCWPCVEDEITRLWRSWWRLAVLPFQPLHGARPRPRPSAAQSANCSAWSVHREERGHNLQHAALMQHFTFNAAAQLTLHLHQPLSGAGTRLCTYNSIVIIMWDNVV